VLILILLSDVKLQPRAHHSCRYYVTLPCPASFPSLFDWKENIALCCFQTSSRKRDENESPYAHLLLFQLVLLLNPGEDLVHVRLEDHAAHDQLVEDEVDLVHVKDEVELAHVFKALVQGLHKHLKRETHEINRSLN
jgi:hypothetical protein